MGSDGLPQVDAARCTGCGTCERVCPKHIITLSSVTRRIMREYTTEDCTTPCQRACPAGIDICAYIGAIADGHYDRALQVIKERNPFPAVIGRICPRPCEQECRRQLVDEPVAINALKRFAADYAAASGSHVLPYKAPASGRRLAVIGGGVSGLASAFFLARLGHGVTVFEARPQAGGLLRTAIARNRLPQSILDADIEGIRAMGVEIQTGKALGAAELLTQGFEAVFTATGGWDSRLAGGAVGGPEAAIPGLELMLDLLGASGTPPPCGPAAVIAGGGAQALEAARRCRQRGAASVTVLLRERAEASPLAGAALEALAAEGIAVRFAAGIVGLQGRGERLQQVTVAPLDGGASAYDLAADTLVIAAGRVPELVLLPLPPAAAPDGQSAESAGIGWQALPPYKAPTFVGQQGLLADGDVLSDHSAAIRAIGAGRRSAASIHQLLNGIALTLPATVLTPDKIIQNVTALEPVKSSSRTLMPLNPGPRHGREELEVGFDESMARREAGRCLRCGLICYRRSPPAAPQAA
jgi:NADPH-dependent glutamate synthase beta subunit-like oxidoreductase